MNSSALGFQKRLSIGKQYEAEIANEVSNFGIPLKPVSEQQDMIGKIDRQVKWTGELASRFPELGIPAGTTAFVQIKSREGYPDFLFDVYEPFYGFNDSRTKEGRDLVGKYELYICRTLEGLFICNANRLKKNEIQGIVTKWKTEGGRTLQEGDVRPRWFSGEKHNMPGVDICVKEDNANYRPKMLIYIKPSSVEEKLCVLQTD